MGKNWTLGMCLGVYTAASCTGKKDDGPGTVPDTETGTTPPATGDTGTLIPDGELLVTSEHNYALDVAWTIASADVRARWDLLLSWDDLTTDAWGLAIDPVNIDQLVLLEVLEPFEDVPGRLSKDDLGAEILSVWTLDAQGEVFAHTADLSSGDTPFNPPGFLAEDNDKTWLLGLASQEGDRLDLRALLALNPIENDTTVNANIDDTTSSISWSASASAAHLLAAPDAELYTIDWEGLTLDALGKEYDDTLGNELFIGRFDAGVDLSTEILTLSESASAWWTMDVERETDARLDLAKDVTGGVFPGFTAGATWLVGVRCTTCLSPFPLWVAAVDVSAPDDAH